MRKRISMKTDSYAKYHPKHSSIWVRLRFCFVLYTSRFLLSLLIGPRQPHTTSLTLDGQTAALWLQYTTTTNTTIIYIPRTFAPLDSRLTFRPIATLKIYLWKLFHSFFFGIVLPIFPSEILCKYWAQIRHSVQRESWARGYNIRKSIDSCARAP